MNKKTLFCWSKEKKMKVGENLKIVYNNDHLWKNDEDLGVIFTSCPHAFYPNMFPYDVKTLKNGEHLKVFVSDSAPVNDFKEGEFYLLVIKPSITKNIVKTVKKFSFLSLLKDPLFWTGILLILNGILLMLKAF